MTHKRFVLHYKVISMINVIQEFFLADFLVLEHCLVGNPVVVAEWANLVFFLVWYCFIQYNHNKKNLTSYCTLL